MTHTAGKAPVENRVASIFVHVTDLRRAAEWYSGLFGLPILEERLSGGPVYWFDMPGTGLVLDSNSNNRLRPGWREDMQPLVMLPCRDIDRAYAYAAGKAEPLMEPERHPGMAYFNFRAPDGRAYMVCRSDGAEPEKPLSGTSPILPRIAGVFLNVREVRHAAAWISDFLQTPLREEEAAAASIYAVDTSGGAALLLDGNRYLKGEDFEIPFMVPTDDVDAAWAYAVETMGMKVFHGIEGHGDVSFFTLEDPDRNLVMVCQQHE